jgi:hypothetical protein
MKRDLKGKLKHNLRIIRAKQDSSKKTKHDQESRSVGLQLLRRESRRERFWKEMVVEDPNPHLTMKRKMTSSKA